MTVNRTIDENMVELMTGQGQACVRNKLQRKRQIGSGKSVANGVKSLIRNGLEEVTAVQASTK